MKKKIALIGLLALFMIPFGACGGQSSDSSSMEEASSSSLEQVESSEEKNESSSELVVEHEYKLVEETQGTCSTKGSVAHYTCAECDKLFDLTKKEIESVDGDYDYSNHSSNASLAIKTQANKLVYNAGDVFDSTGMVIVCKCADCDGEIIDNQFLTCVYQTENASAFSNGDTKVTLSYNGMSVDVEVGVGKAQAQIFGAKEAYETVCGVAPVIEVTSNTPDSDIVIAYYDGETVVQASELTAGKSYVVKMSIAGTETLVGTEVSATLNVAHNQAWTAKENNADELVYQCVCGISENYSVLNNQVLYVDDTDMSVDLSKLVKGAQDYSIQSVQQILLLNNKEKVAIEGEKNGSAYTFAKEKYEKTASETLEDGTVVYYTPYELALAVEYAFGDNTVEVTYVVKYVDKVIRTAEDLLVLAYDGAASQEEGGLAKMGQYVLANDIDASGLTLGAADHAWQALIGFRGVFEGNGYTVSNLHVPAWNNGLFGALGFGSKIQNVSFTNVTVDEGGYLFALVIRNSQMTNVNVEFSGSSASFALAVSANETSFDKVSIATKEGVKPFKIDENDSTPIPDSITFTYIEVETPDEPEIPEIPDTTTLPDDTDREKVAVSLAVGQMTDTGTTNEYGKVYNLKQGQWFIDNAQNDANNLKTMADFQANALANALPQGGEWLVFWLYNPTATEYQFHLAGGNNGWTDSKYYINLTPNAWTKVVVSAAEIEMNKSAAWYMYILGGNDDGAAQAGWQMSAVYAVMEEGWTPEPISKVLLDASKETLGKGCYGGEIVVNKTVDELVGNVWVVTIGETDQGQQALHHNAIDTSYYASVYFYVYNPLAKEARLSINGGWTDWGVATVMLAPKNWTRVELPMSVFASDIAGKIFPIIQDPNAISVAGEWKISSFYGLEAGETAPEIKLPEVDTPDVPTADKQEVALNLGQMTDTGTTNEYGKVYNVTQGQWFVDNSIKNTMVDFQKGVLASALPAGYAYFEFYIYNPTDTEYTFHLAGETNGWTDSVNNIALAAKGWTKVIILADEVEMNKAATWYMYILGGNGDGAAQAGWQVSSVYAVKA